MVPSSDPTVFVVDDDHDIRSALSRALSKRGFEVKTFSSAQAFLDAYSNDMYGCLVLDYGMPGMNGLELQEMLVAKGTPLPIIFITGHGGVPESVKAIKAGAIDFLEKPFRTETLVERINAAFETLVKRNEAWQKTADATAKFESLTAREREIADFMVSNPSQATSKDIARALHISPRTVDHHRARILEKMNIKSSLQLIELANLAQLDRNRSD